MAGVRRFLFVSVVIPAYNEERLLPLCLESLRNQDYGGDYEVIVVDNASTDSTAQVALSRGVKVVHEGRRSPACARQRGLEEAKGEVVAFIDADTQAPPHWLSTIVRPFCQDPKTVAVSGPYAFGDAGDFTRIVSYVGNFLSICMDQLIRRALNQGGALWGSNFAVRRSVLLAIGGFNTDIKFLGEDYELSLRLKGQGRIRLIPGLFVLTSARRLKAQGFVTTYWNYIVNYFSVLLYHKPIPESLENWPQKARQTLLASPLWDRYGLGRRYSVLSLGLLLILFAVLWLTTHPVVAPARRLAWTTPLLALGALLVYQGVNPTAQLYGRVCSHGQRNRPRLALTFDDGPNEPYTSQVLNILRQYGIKATFFVIGENVKRYPQVCKRALAEGNVIGIHSYHHYKLLGLRWSKSIAREINLTQEAVFRATGYCPKLFRPPYGYRTPWLLLTVRHLGYTVITWDDMTNDWKATKPAEKIIRAIVKKARPGSIITLHDGRGTRGHYDRSQMLRALPQIIEALQQRGFEFTTVPELLEEETTQLQRRVRPARTVLL